jgi:hypothetical protein
MMPAAVDAWNVADPTVCPVCDRDACEDHLPSARGADTPMLVKPRLRSFTLAALRAHRFPPRRTLLSRDGQPVLKSGQLAEVFAARGLGKTWLLQTLGLVAASGRSALGFEAPSPCRVLNIDGEMAGEDLRDRLDLLAVRLGVPGDAPFTTIAADWQDQYLPRLDTQAGQDLDEPFIEAADLIILDNRSCLFDPEGEKDPTAWQPAQDWLLSLRRRGKTVLLAHHSNRQGGARGHSKAEDPLDLILKLERPDDYIADQGSRFVATFEKARGVHGAAVSPFTASLTPDGWHVEGVSAGSPAAGRLLDYVRLAERASERVRSATAAITGARVNRNQGFKAWAELLESGAIHKHPEGGFGAR